MARNDGVDRTVARNRDLKNSSAIHGAQGHNERQRESYANPDIVLERTPFNVHFKAPTASYEEMFSQLEQEKIISTWGQKPDSTRFCELVFDVNSAYFFNHGGYEFAKRFYADAYKAAVKIVGGEQYILSAVMHADERNRAISEALGQDVYHYHLHVVYVPVVEKQILWSKRCKDPALVGTVKETVMQVSRSKKWESGPVLNEDGSPMRNAKGKKILKPSYSVLQDDFFHFMQAAGYPDIQRGERGSTEEHLTVTQFKVEQEQQRLTDLTEAKEQTLEELAALSEKKEKTRSKLNALTPKLKHAEAFVQQHVSSLEELLPEAGSMERARTYREEKALPFVQKLKRTILSLYRSVVDLREELAGVKRKLDDAVRSRDRFSEQLQESRAEAALFRESAEDLQRVRRALGSERLGEILSRERKREQAEQEKKRPALHLKWDRSR